MNELQALAIVCAILGGEREAHHPFELAAGSHFVRVDCETDTYAIEVGLDQRWALDSVQQAIFAAEVTGKAPMVVLIDLDGEEGAVEFQVEAAAHALGIEYRTYRPDYLLRWQMTAYFRQRREEILEALGR